MHLRVAEIEQPHSFEHLCAGSRNVLPAQVGGNAFEQPGPIFRAVLAILLKLNEVGADEPVAEDEVAVDRPRRAGLGLLVSGGDGGKE